MYIRIQQNYIIRNLFNIILSMTLIVHINYIEKYDLFIFSKNILCKQYVVLEFSFVYMFCVYVFLNIRTYVQIY